MIDSISSWAGQIVIAVVVVTILEMILPNGNNKKYIKTIIGIYILFIIVYPIITYVSDGNLNFDAILASYEIENEVSNEEDLSIQTNNQVKKIYIEDLETKIEENIKNEGYTVENIELSVNLDSEEKYGEITALELIISKESNANNAVENKVIEPINIQIGDNKIEEKSKNISEEEIENIKEILVESYEINKDKIIIKEV